MQCLSVAEISASLQESSIPLLTLVPFMNRESRALKSGFSQPTAKRHIFGCHLPHSLAEVLSNHLPFACDSLSLSLPLGMQTVAPRRDCFYYCYKARLRAPTYMGMGISVFD